MFLRSTQSLRAYVRRAVRRRVRFKRRDSSWTKSSARVMRIGGKLFAFAKANMKRFFPKSTHSGHFFMPWLVQDGARFTCQVIVACATTAPSASHTSDCRTKMARPDPSNSRLRFSSDSFGKLACAKQVDSARRVYAIFNSAMTSRWRPTPRALKMHRPEAYSAAVAKAQACMVPT